MLRQSLAWIAISAGEERSEEDLLSEKNSESWRGWEGGAGGARYLKSKSASGEGSEALMSVGGNLKSEKRSSVLEGKRRESDELEAEPEPMAGRGEEIERGEMTGDVPGEQGCNEEC